MAKPKVHIDLTEFLFSHQAPPRGWGYWAFEIRQGPEVKWFQCLYSEARKQAKDWAIATARAAGYEGDLDLVVLP